MQQALESVDNPIDYVNTHGTATPVGDTQEIAMLREVFGDRCPPISSTKSLSGHSQGAAGVHEAVYSILMMNNDFLTKSANIEELDPDMADMPILRERKDTRDINCILSNSFGFGGTNACLVMQRYNG